MIEGTEGERISFQEAFPRALQTFSSSNLVGAVLSNSVVAGQNAGKCFMGLGSEEGAYTLHWQAVLPGGTAWMAQGHWEPSSPTDSTPLPSPFRFFLLPLSPESLLSNYWRAMSTKVVFAKVLLRCEEATLDKEGSEGGKIGVGRTMGDKQ